MLNILFLIFLLFMVAQGIISVYLTLYVWEDADRIDAVASPKIYESPRCGFTVLLPAHHEEQVIAQTIRSISQSNYPAHLLQIMAICDASDIGTIAAANAEIQASGLTNAEVLIFNEGPLNKPYRLNKGLQLAKHDKVVIFDAEDEVHPDIFNIANTLYVQKDPDIIQAGVQLMNYDSNWFSVHNVLEYFFWFKSRMHFHTRVGMVPLGGNTVFFKTLQLIQVGGWNENCLTEDAEIGIRMTVRGAKILSTYDPEHVTKEETPHSVGQFIKQRTRWNQGFIQVLRLGHWRKYDSLAKRIFCFYTLAFPIYQAVLLLLTPVILIFGFYGHIPILLSLLSFVPILILFIQYMISAVGIRELIKEQNLPYHRSIYIKMLITLLPYQFLLGVGAVRATYRELRGIKNWEKTAHTGAHRTYETRVTEAS
jgi:cellulose synthase/poly-beta-1,6-N-acetylglucosamine synthase-like glycosyltransferase